MVNHLKATCISETHCLEHTVKFHPTTYHQKHRKGSRYFKQDENFICCNFAKAVTFFAEGVWEQMLRRMFGPKKNEVTGEWRKLHIEELNDLYSSPNIVRMNKSRRMRWAANVARIGEERRIEGFGE